MSLPGHRRTKSHKRRRASHFALRAIGTVECKQCKKPTLPHRVCQLCGYYKGRAVVAMPVKKKKS